MGGPRGWSGQVRKMSPPPGFDPRTIQLVASHYTNYATWPTGGEKWWEKVHNRGIEEAPENLKESLHSAHPNGMECKVQLVKLLSMQLFLHHYILICC